MQEAHFKAEHIARSNLEKSVFDSIDEVQQRLLDKEYVASRALATIVFISVGMGKPLFLEGEAGVGKTELAKVLAQLFGTKLIRLQCYEGLDVHNAVYEWAYSRQLLHLKLLEASGVSRVEMERDLYGPDFLLARPLLQAIQNSADNVPILLIDELDRADEEFESFLLEILSDFQVTIPEIGTFKAAKPPIVVVTSNRTRQIHDALKRRCVYHWIDYPSFDAELQILQLKLPNIGPKLSRQIVFAVQQLRREELFKPPGIAETLDWGQALHLMNCQQLTEQVVLDTLGVVLKYQDDVEKVEGALARQLVMNENG